MTEKKKVIILRGHSGSGKSTYIKRKLSDAVVCSADSFFVDKKSGDYNFNPKLLGVAHGACRKKFERALKASEPLVVVDNTNTRHREYKDYLKLAKQYGYQVEFVRMDTPVDVAADRNTHGVPLAAVERMAARMDTVPDGYLETLVSGVE